MAAQVCEVWQGLSYNSRKDTKLTIDGIKINNRKRDAFCAVQAK